jgi:hypothetical protein
LDHAVPHQAFLFVYKESLHSPGETPSTYLEIPCHQGVNNYLNGDQNNENHHGANVCYYELTCIADHLELFVVGRILKVASSDNHSVYVVGRNQIQGN